MATKIQNGCQNAINDYYVNLKSMPFIQVVGDQPVYALMVQLKYENPDKFKLVIPVLGSFNTQMSFITAINKRKKECDIADLVVAEGVIAQGSVEQALRGKHYSRGIHMVYEVLARLLMRKGRDEGITFSENHLGMLRDPVNYSPDNRHKTFEFLLSDD